MATLYKWKKYYIYRESYQELESYQKPVTKYRTETYTVKEYQGKGWTRSGFKSESDANAFASIYNSAPSTYGTMVGHDQSNPGTYYVLIMQYSDVEKTKKVPYTDYETDYRYVTKYKDAKGSYSSEVTSENRYAYPHDGASGGYWYVFAGEANRSPSITGSNSSIGSVKENFSISYTVTDPDGDGVKVEIRVDNKVLQYPISVPLGQEQRVEIRLADYSLGEHTITAIATDSQGASATKTWTFAKTNEAPTISGSDLSLGAKSKSFDVEYIIQDADGDAVKVEIRMDDKIVQDKTTTTLGVRKYYTVDIGTVSLGSHKLKIIAEDSYGARAERVYSFEKVNSAPVISGKDENLGAKNTAFSYTYQVHDNEGDSVQVIERLNGKVIRTLNNATLDTDLTITVSSGEIQKLDINALNTIEIEATDGNATSYRRVTFARNNMPPIISGTDSDLGEKTSKLEYKYSVTDPERDEAFVTVYMDGKAITSREKVVDGASRSLIIDGMDFMRMTRGKHTIKIVAEDSNGSSSQRTVTFTRVIKRAIAELASPIETDQLATRVLVSAVGVYVSGGAVAKYEVCNNAFDSKPTWEDATIMVNADRAYRFQNTTKTATKAGINIRITIDKGTSTMQSYISAIGGSFD